MNWAILFAARTKGVTLLFEVYKDDFRKIREDLHGKYDKLQNNQPKTGLFQSKRVVLSFIKT